MPYRILVTGSRDWLDAERVDDAICDRWQAHDWYKPQDQPPTSVVVVHGACPTGADLHARQAVERLKSNGWPVDEEPHPADWKTWGPAAGPRRNIEMAMSEPDICLAFLMPCSSLKCKRTDAHWSHGGSHCAEEAKKRDVKTVYFYA